VPLILIGGGARSGKSRFALCYARRLGPSRVFVATAQAFDDEMRARIDRHRQERGVARGVEEFATVEAPLDLVGALAAASPGAVVLVDCLTLWLSNLLLADRDDAEVLRAIDELVGGASRRSAPTLLVSNEVGMGLVPETPLGRRFRDLTGIAHQRLAAVAAETYAAVMGVVLRLYPEPIRVFRAGETP
jgi:adenosylcobinamide kinase / adenosylcobinamide-phosphate guanylyltransferase